MIAFDIESTGLNPTTEAIVELAVFDENAVCLFHQVFKPHVPISEGATKAHGITNEIVELSPTFSDFAPEVQILIAEQTLLTYSGRSFDTIMLDAELRRAGQPGIDLANVREIDLYRVWCEAEPRTLLGAARKFLDVDLEAHSAYADANVLPSLLKQMAEDFDLDEREMVEMSKPSWEVDRSGKLRKNDDGEVVWNFGRNRGERVKDHEGLIWWVLDRDFPADCKAALERIVEESGLKRWKRNAQATKTHLQ